MEKVHRCSEEGCSVYPPSSDLNTKKAAHFSDSKSGVDQIPVEILLEWGEVFTMGAEKYGRDNWKGGTDWHEFYGSALRHMFAFWKGEDTDPESGLPHLAHAIWNLATIRYYQLHKLGMDTRNAPACPDDDCQIKEYHQHKGVPTVL